NLDTLYAASPGNFSVAYTPDRDAMVTMRPSPAEAIGVNAARQHRNAPVRLIPSVCCHMAVVVSANGAGVSTAAAQTSGLGGPSRVETPVRAQAQVEVKPVLRVPAAGGPGNPCCL